MNKIGVVQATPCLFDVDNTIPIVEKWIRKASQEKCQLVLFPEAFVPGYPRGLDFGTVVGKRTEKGKKQWQDYWENSIEVPGRYTEMLGELARQHDTYLAIGVSERDSTSKTLYCTLLYFNPDGKLLAKHRKIKPTGSERVIWGEGDGSTLSSINSRIGKIGGLICWENYMPLARMTMYKKGVEIYLAPTADNRESWLTALKHIAVEGRCYVLGANQYVCKDHYPLSLREEIKEKHEIMSPGGSVIISPNGKVLDGPLYNAEGLLTAEYDPGEVVRSRMDFDVIGHYSRDDIFDFRTRDIPDIIQDTRSEI
jgi:nitrilase